MTSGSPLTMSPSCCVIMNRQLSSGSVKPLPMSSSRCVILHDPSMVKQLSISLLCVLSLLSGSPLTVTPSCCVILLNPSIVKQLCVVPPGILRMTSAYTLNNVALKLCDATWSVNCQTALYGLLCVLCMTSGFTLNNVALMLCDATCSVNCKTVLCVFSNEFNSLTLHSRLKAQSH